MPQAATVRTAANHLHVARMATYMAAARNDERLALDLYLWNVRMSAAFMETISITEIVMRNNFDAKLGVWNVSKGGGFTSAWTDRAAAPLNSLTSSAIKRARDNAFKARAKRLPTHPRKHSPVNHDDVLAQLTFGVYARLMPTGDTTDNSYKQRRILWNEVLSSVFAGRPSEDWRVHSGRVDRIHALRNRVAHAEPILEVHARSRLRDMVRLVDSIDPALAGWVSGTSRIVEVSRDRPV